jgi:hypothetical protein
MIVASFTPTMDSEEDWVRCFATASDQLHPEQAKQAFDHINRVLHENPAMVLRVSCNLVLYSGYPLGARQVAALAISRSLRTESDRQLADLCEKWRLLPQLAAHAKTAIRATILCDDGVIRTAAAQAMAFVIAIERDAAADALREIFETLQRSLDQPAQAIGLLSVFNELFHVLHFNDLKTLPLFECYIPFFLQAIDLLGSENPVDIELRMLASVVVRDALEFIPELCLVNGEVDLARIQVVLAALSPALALLHEFIFESCHRIMFNLVKSYYSKADEFMGPIFDLTYRALQMSEPNQEKYRKSALAFWKELAVLECEIAETTKLEGKDILPGKHVCKAAPLLLPLFFEIMSHIDPNDTAIEDPNDPSAATYATVVFQAFFNAIPDMVFHNVIVPTFNTNIISEDWTHRHAAILLLDCMCPLDVGLPVQESEEGLQFIAQNMPHLLAACREHHIPRLAESSLYVLDEILSNYPGVMSQQRLCPDSVHAVHHIVNLFVIDDKVHPFIIARYCLIISSLARLWKHDCLQWRSPLPTFFTEFVTFLRQIMQRCQGLEAAMDVYKDAADALNYVILLIPEPEQRNSELNTLFTQILDDLEATCCSMDSDAIRFGIQANLCSNLGYLAHRLRHRLRDEHVHRAVTMLLNLLRSPNTLLYEEGLLSLAKLYNSVSHAFELDQVMLLLSIVEFALLSESPGVINAASVLLGELFRLSGPMLADRLLAFFEMEVSLLQKYDQVRDIHPYIIKTLADMLESVGRSPADRPLLEPLRERVFGLMQMVRAVPIDLGKEADLIYANYLFESLTQLYRVFAELYYPLVQPDDSTEKFSLEKVILNEMANLAQSVFRLGDGVVQERVLVEFILMAKAYAAKCSRKNTVTLNKRSVHNVMNLTQANRLHANTRKLGKEVIKVLKST